MRLLMVSLMCLFTSPVYAADQTPVARVVFVCDNNLVFTIDGNAAQIDYQVSEWPLMRGPFNASFDDGKWNIVLFDSKGPLYQFQYEGLASFFEPTANNYELRLNGRPVEGKPVFCVKRL